VPITIEDTSKHLVVISIQVVDSAASSFSAAYNNFLYPYFLGSAAWLSHFVYLLGKCSTRSEITGFAWGDLDDAELATVSHTEDGKYFVSFYLPYTATTIPSGEFPIEFTYSAQVGDEIGAYEFSSRNSTDSLRRELSPRRQ
jgi:hypothetical protein